MGYSLEGILDKVISEFGFKDQDVIVAEVIHHGNWIFHYDPRELIRSPKDAFEIPNYSLYWETANRRPFSDHVTPIPGYKEILGLCGENKSIIEEKNLQTPDEKNFELEFSGISEANITNETSELPEFNKDSESSTKMTFNSFDTKHIFDSGKSEDSARIMIEPTDMKVKIKVSDFFQRPNNFVHINLPAQKELHIVKKHIGRPSGLQNIGNTCYLNSSIQCLKHTKLLTFALEKLNIDLLGSVKITSEFKKLIKNLKNEESSISTSKFKKAIDVSTDQFPLNNQCDAHEFLMFLINKLYDEVYLIGNKTIADRKGVV